MGATTTIYYASDVHGSNRCFRKFLNAAKYYKASVLVMGGDILGKAIVFLEELRPGVYTTQEHGRTIELSAGSELADFEKRPGDKGLYPYRCRLAVPHQSPEPHQLKTPFPSPL